MSISSEQYKTALFEQCRRAVRISDEARRVAYYNMVYRVLEHDGVVVDAEGYERFRMSIEGYLNYLSDNNLTTAQSAFTASDFADRIYEYWVEAFANIGIIMAKPVKESNLFSASLTFTFTYPDETTESYKLTNLDFNSPVELNARFNSTLDYAKKMMPYWDIQPDENTIPLNEIFGNRASYITNWGEGGVYWSYDSENREIEFTGVGTLIMTPSQFTSSSDGLGLGIVETAIYGAGVNGLPPAAFNWGSDGGIRTIVCMHGATDAVVLHGVLCSGSSSTPSILNIYCDNETIRAGTFGNYVTVNWYPLSEWAG